MAIYVSIQYNGGFLPDVVSVQYLCTVTRVGLSPILYIVNPMLIPLWNELTN